MDILHTRFTFTNILKWFTRATYNQPSNWNITEAMERVINGCITVIASEGDQVILWRFHFNALHPNSPVNNNNCHPHGVPYRGYTKNELFMHAVRAYVVVVAPVIR